VKDPPRLTTFIIRSLWRRRSRELKLMPTCTVTKSTPCLACFLTALNMSSEVISTTTLLEAAAWYIGTVPTGMFTALRMRVRISSRSPPVERSITALAPRASAVFAFSTSASMSIQSLEVPTLALIFVLMYLPIPTGRVSLTLFFGMAISPFATQERTISGSIPSAFATASIEGAIIPFFASSISVIVTPDCEIDKKL